MAQAIHQLAALLSRMAAVPGTVLFPAVCPGCQRHVSEHGAVCARCWQAIRFLDPPWCPVMGTTFAHDMGEGFLSAEAIADPPPFARARSAVLYAGLAGRLVQALKYGDRTDLALPMARWMARAGFELLPEADAVVPVPLHRGRMLARRFNQSAELARALCAHAGLKHRPGWLMRRRPTRRQVGLTADQRADNVRAAFMVPPSQRPALKGRRVLLVDDVYTTGATVRAATRALMRGGAAAVDVLTFARVPPGDFRPDETEPI